MQFGCRLILHKIVVSCCARARPGPEHCTHTFTHTRHLKTKNSLTWSSAELWEKKFWECSFHRWGQRCAETIELAQICLTNSSAAINHTLMCQAPKPLLAVCKQRIYWMRSIFWGLLDFLIKGKKMHCLEVWAQGFWESSLKITWDDVKYLAGYLMHRKCSLSHACCVTAFGISTYLETL